MTLPVLAVDGADAAPPFSRRFLAEAAGESSWPTPDDRWRLRPPEAPLRADMSETDGNRATGSSMGIESARLRCRSPQARDAEGEAKTRNLGGAVPFRASQTRSSDGESRCQLTRSKGFFFSQPQQGTLAAQGPSCPPASGDIPGSREDGIYWICGSAALLQPLLACALAGWIHLSGWKDRLYQALCLSTQRGRQRPDRTVFLQARPRYYLR
jgi:hypothetical protein